jgi:phage shock protein C
MVCPACGTGMSDGARYCSVCGRPAFEAQASVRPRLVRPLHGRLIAGVCAGFAQAYGWDPVIVRLVLCLIALCGAGTPIIAYIIAWIVMPNAPYELPHQPTGVTPS